MTTIIEQMLENYERKTQSDEKNAIKEIMQEMVLCGLSRAGFFKDAAFYGGTALRIFYGLDRFSEDLDFSLIAKNETFDLSIYLPVLKKEIQSFGLNVVISEKEKSLDSNIQSAFLKGSTKEHLLLFFGNQDFGGIQSEEKTKIKFEVDINPPDYAKFEHKYRLLPSPYEIRIYDPSSLFAVKIHAVLCRTWKNRVKGRDLYDYVFYLSRKTPVNFRHLHERLVQTGYLSQTEIFTLVDLKQSLKRHFDEVNYTQAKQDVIPFVRNSDSLNVWGADFFNQITEELTSVD